MTRPAWAVASAISLSACATLPAPGFYRSPRVAQAVVLAQYVEAARRQCRGPIELRHFGHDGTEYATGVNVVDERWQVRACGHRATKELACAFHDGGGNRCRERGNTGSRRQRPIGRPSTRCRTAPAESRPRTRVRRSPPARVHGAR